MAYDAVDATGNYPVQPRLLDDQPRSFDQSKIPFRTADNQGAASGYATAAIPRAMVLGTSSTYAWQTGETPFDAIAAALTAYQKQDASRQCPLYAVSNRVVFSPGDY